MEDRALLINSPTAHQRSPIANILIEFAAAFGEILE